MVVSNTLCIIVVFLLSCHIHLIKVLSLLKQYLVLLASCFQFVANRWGQTERPTFDVPNANDACHCIHQIKDAFVCDLSLLQDQVLQ